MKDHTSKQESKPKPTMHTVHRDRDRNTEEKRVAQEGQRMLLMSVAQCEILAWS